MTTLFGLFAFLGYSFTGSLRRKMKNHIKVWLCVILTALLVGCQWSAVSTASDRLGSRARLLPQIEVSAGSGSDRVTKATFLDQAGQSNAPGNLPARFEANQGQADQQIKFISCGKDYNLYLAPDETLIALNRQQADKRISPQRHGEHGESVSALRASVVNKMETHQPQSADFIRMKFVGANSDPKMTGLEELPARTNYYRGKDRENWQADIPSYAKVKYEQVYDGIDLLYYGNDGQIEYDFIVAPGAGPGAIGLEIEGAEEVEIDSTGDLVLKTSDGQLRHRKPVVYQESNGGRRQIEGRYSVIRIPSPGLSTPDSRHPTFLVGFEIGEYDPSMPLVIDPVLEYSTYLGGSGDDQGTALATDSQGNIYVVGITDSIDLPTMNASQPAFGGGGQDVFVAKIDATGTRLEYLTYLGGSDLETATGLAVDSSGNAYISGFTRSTNFPTQNALQPDNRGQFNGFVSKIGATGNLIYSTYLGGSVNDSASAIAVDSAGNSYVAGIATSGNFPVVNAAQANLSGASDLYVAKLNPSGNQLIYSTFVGGSQEDAATSIAVDPSGNAYVTGTTLSMDFRRVNAAQMEHGGGIFDAFVVKLNPAGNQIIYSTYLGGGNADRGFRITADPSGAAYIVGDTFSTNFPVRGALQQTAGGSADAFVAKFSASGTIVYSTYLGGSGIDGGTSISVDSTGAALVTGFTESRNFPLSAALQRDFGGGDFDAFVAKLTSNGSALEYSTYLGGSGTDTGFGIISAAQDRAYVMGLTDSPDFPTVSPLQAANNGGASDLFIAKIRPGPTIESVQVKGKNVLITGSGFQPGARILLDGEEQKTKVQSAIRLKGKKVATKIAPGAMVRLQVRNPDGVTSAEFSFTRAAQ